MTDLPTAAEARPERYAQARGYLDEALAIAEQLRDASGRAAALAVLGNAARLHGDPHDSIPAYQEALALAESVGRRDLVPAILINLGAAHGTLREAVAAARHYEQAIAQCEQLKDDYGLARACWHYGSLILRPHEERGGEPDVAEARRGAQLWQRAVDLERAGRMPAAQAHAEALAHILTWLSRQEESGADHT